MKIISILNLSISLPSVLTDEEGFSPFLLAKALIEYSELTQTEMKSTQGINILPLFQLAIT
jgi:hypothetical protein